MKTLNRQKLMINAKAALLVVASFIAVYIIPMAFAKDGNEAPKAMLEQILEGPLKMIIDTVSGSDESPFKKLWDLCTGDFEDGSVFKTAFNSLKLIGGAFAFIIFGINLFKDMEREQNPIEAIWRGLIELFMVLLVIINLTDILDFFTMFGKETISVFGSTAEDKDLTGKIEDILKKLSYNDKSSGGLSWNFYVSMQLMLPWALSQIVTISAKFAVMQVAIDIFIRKLFTPLAIADIYKEGLRSPGVRWLKRYLGAYLKAAVCAAVAVLVSTFAKDILTVEATSAKTVLDSLITIIAVNFTAIGVMLKAGEYTNDMVGA